MDKKLWANIAIGDKAAYSEVYIFYYKKLFNYGRKITDDSALIEDTIDEIFIMTWINRKNFSTIISPQAYIFSSFRNNIYKKLKSLKRIQFSDTETDTEVQFSADSILIQRETDEALKDLMNKALQKISARQREAIFLRFYEGLSYTEIADVMSITVKATYKVMARGLGELREIFSTTMAVLLMILRQIN